MLASLAVHTQNLRNRDGFGKKLEAGACRFATTWHLSGLVSMTKLTGESNLAFALHRTAMDR
jgi:hypothetical protein